VIAQALVSVAVSAQDVALAIYLNSMGYSSSEIGLVLAITSITAISLLLPGGILADSYGRRRIASMGLLLGSLSLFGYLYPVNIYYLFLLAFVGGVGSALYGGSIAAILADVAPTPGKRNLLFSVSASVYSLAGILGSLLGGSPSYLRSLGYPTWYQYFPAIVAMGISLAASSLMILFIRGDSRGDLGKGGGRPSLVLPIKSRIVIVKGVIYGVLFSLAVGLIGRSIFSLWLKSRYGAPEGLISYIYAIAQTVLMFAFLASPAIAKKLGSVGSIVMLQAIGFSLLLPIALTNSFAVAGALYATIIVLLSLPNPILRSFLIGLVDPSERASASTVIALSMNLSGSFTPAITGYLMSSASLEAPLYLSGLIGSSSVALFYILFSSHGKGAS
jgi:predicted MFS family arabinose efflux permease